MRILFLYLMVLLCSLKQVAAQGYCTGGCLTNGTFEGVGGCAIPIGIGGCASWSGSCNGWYVSHGSPQEFATATGSQVHKYISCSNDNYMYMWSQYTNGHYGEGAYTAYTFSNGVSYDVRIAFSVGVNFPLFPQGTSNGKIYIYAVQGLTPASGADCGDIIPNNGSIHKQLIKTYDVTDNGTIVDDVFSFTAQAPSGTPGNQLTQIWIYPDGADGGNSGSPYLTLRLSSIFLCPSPNCPEQIVYYNTGNVPASVSNGTVYIGSTDGTGGSGTVVVQPGIPTSVVASNFIRIDPDFNATVGQGSVSFSITPCSAPSLYNMKAVADVYDSVNIGNSQAPPVTDMETTGTKTTAAVAFQPVSQVDDLSAAKLQVYPTVSSGAFTITGSAGDLANADITITDEQGRQVYRLQNGGNTTVRLNLNLSSGLYLLQIRQGSKVTNQKIIISR